MGAVAVVGRRYAVVSAFLYGEDAAGQLLLPRQFGQGDGRITVIVGAALGQHIAEREIF